MADPNNSFIRHAAVNRLPRDFYARPAREVARDLIGRHLALVRNGVLQLGRIVETEAYEGPEDLAAHSAGGRRTPRTEVMFGAPGHAYVYLVYGMWNCLNVVTADAGVPHAVLLRALEPLAGINGSTHGPGLLARALGVDLGYNGQDLCGQSLWITGPPRGPQVRVSAGPRIGVDYAGEWARRPWRFYDADSPYVSTAAGRRRRLQVTGSRTARGPRSPHDA